MTIQLPTRLAEDRQILRRIRLALPTMLAEAHRTTLAEAHRTTLAEAHRTTLAEDRPTTLAEDRPTTLAEDRPTTLAEDRPIRLAEDRPIRLAEDRPTTLAEDRPIRLAEDRPTTLAEDRPIRLAEDRQILRTTGTCIQAGTRLLGLLGADIRHADLAFSFNNHLLSYWGRKYVYVPYSVSAGELASAVQGIRALDILACNVTFPHKVTIMDHLDAIDDATRRMGSVNLVVNREGVLWGYNTDSMGFMDALRATGLMGELDTALIYGAGGAGRALAASLAAAGMSRIWLYDIVEDRSRAVESRLNGNGCRVCAVAPDDLPHLRPDLIVNATPLGRGEQADISPLVDLATGRDARLFFDLNYNPPRSRFLRQAEALGVPAENGLRMMCYQAKRSIDLAVAHVPFDWFYAALRTSEMEGHMVVAGSGPAAAP